MTLLKRLIYNRKLLIIVLVPIILLPILFIPDDDVLNNVKPSTKFECAFVILLIAFYWMTEAIPLAITSLLPVVFFPLLGILDTSRVSENYMKETNIKFIGGLIVALAIEYCHLHRRIALGVMSVVGGSPNRLMMGIMVTTTFLSMWMSNTGTTAMMLPAVMAVCEELNETEKLEAKRASCSSSIRSPHKHRDSVLTNPEMESGKGGHEGSLIHFRNLFPLIQNIESQIDESFEKRRINQKKMYLFAVAYCSSIGGTGAITGAGTNHAFLEIIKKEDISQGGKYLDINFTTWLTLNVPIMILNTVVAYFYLTIYYFGLPNWLRFGRLRKSSDELAKEIATSSSVSQMLKEQYRGLGSMTFHQVAVSVLFILIVLLWVTREPGFVTGWAEKLNGAETGDSTAAMLVVFLLFLVPRDLNVFFGDLPVKNPGALLEWKHVQTNLPWGAVLLLGAGFAISDATEVSGLSAWIGEQLNGLQDLPPWLILLVVMTMTALITEFASNLATANILIPILISLSKTLNLHPLYLTVATAVTCSYAFMLPVATPSNAIIFAAGDITIMDMVKTGAFLNFSCVLIFFCLNITYGSWLFGYGDYIYADSDNAT